VIRVACMPKATSCGIYYRLFYGALERYWIIFVPCARYDLRNRPRRPSWAHE
jgi:hypothetical protein